MFVPKEVNDASQVARLTVFLNPRRYARSKLSLTHLFPGDTSAMEASGCQKIVEEQSFDRIRSSN